ncbi:Alpha/beta hydrolase family-domain-containing protein [Mycena leptocephala]|nr:Alpha/beta hydrolase family-domain-containing protein [Mycena leptocephala]
MLLRTLSVLLLHLSSLCFRLGAASASCSCSSVIVPVHVDALVPKDPSDVLGGLKSNLTSLRRVNTTYDIYGVFCRPDAGNEGLSQGHVLQLLAHGFSYTSQYWSPPIEEFRNYSYAAFSCERGLPSLAVDLLGAGLSSRPANASDVQFPTSAAALSQLAQHLKTAPILPGVGPFQKIIGIGHSLGSALFSFGAVVDGAQSPFDALVLTSFLIFSPNDPPPGSGTSTVFIAARDANPLRWGALDPAYATVNDRTTFYPADLTAYSPRMLLFDGFTKDVGPLNIRLQVASSSIPAANYTGAVAKVVGAQDQVSCGADRCVDVETLTAAEQVTWPAVKSFEVLVLQGGGHDLNLDFQAGVAFETIFRLVATFSEKAAGVLMHTSNRKIN